MTIREEDCIDWKNGTVGVGAENATFLEAKNLNKINTKTKEALEALDTQINDNFATFQQKIENGEIIAGKAEIGVNDVDGNPIKETYTKLSDFNDFTSKVKRGDIVLGKSEISNETLRVTESIGPDVVILGDTPEVGSSDTRPASVQFVTNTFNKALDDALE